MQLISKSNTTAAICLSGWGSHFASSLVVGSIFVSASLFVLVLSSIFPLASVFLFVVFVYPFVFVS